MLLSQNLWMHKSAKSVEISDAALMNTTTKSNLMLLFVSVTQV